jgi:hypothetical protein
VNFADMYAGWNQAALDNPMTAIVSNESKWDQGRFFETGKTWLGEQLVFATAAGVRIGGVRALDFGCGVGRMTAGTG